MICKVSEIIYRPSPASSNPDHATARFPLRRAINGVASGASDVAVLQMVSSFDWTVFRFAAGALIPPPPAIN